MALYQKYRSKNLDTIIGQKHITEVLKAAINRQQVSHAYLFTGPRGVGKTSIARIVAHEINGIEYTGTSPEDIDIIEIDAASHGSVEHIRDMREKAFIAPAISRYKVYIIDEVHMLSSAAFNALLKIIEEPPKHLIFILATTEAHKVPDTIISRTQRFSFREIPVGLLKSHILQIAESENISITEDAAKILAERARGSARDALSIFEQVADSGKEVDADSVLQILGLASTQLLDNITENILNNNAIKAISELSSALQQGVQVELLAEQLARHWLDHNLKNETQKLPLEIIKQILEASSRANVELMLEVLLVQATTPIETVTKPPIVENAQASPAKPRTQPTKQISENITSNTQAQTKADTKTTPPVEKIDKTAETQSSEPVIKTSLTDKNLWKKIITVVKKNYKPLSAILQLAQFQYDRKEELVKLGFSYPFHKRQVEEASNRQKLLDILRDELGSSVRLEIVKIEKSGPAAPLVQNKVLDMLGGEPMQLEGGA